MATGIQDVIGTRRGAQTCSFVTCFYAERHPRPTFREVPHLRPVPAQLSAHGVHALEGCA